MYSSMSSGLIRPQLRSTIFFWPLKNGTSSHGGIERVAAAIVELRGDVVPLLDLAQDEAFGKCPSRHPVEDLADLIWSARDAA